MIRKSAAVLMFACLVAPAHAGFTAEKLEDDVYFVSYERGRWTSGTVFDTARKAQRKLEKGCNRLCIEQDFRFMRILTTAEIAEDEDLRSAWELWVGDEAADTFQISGGDDGLVSKAHKSRRVLVLSRERMEGFRACVIE
jgi:hypothetical protein